MTVEKKTNRKTDEELEFRWGKKKGLDANKKAQFYGSFKFDGVEYSLYDSVYLYKDGESEPYVGKLLKIWEQSGKNERKIKVLWFFRPSEISNYLQDVDVLKNELFLATGIGTGLTNINPLLQDKSKWFTASSWEDRMKFASDEERLVHLQNLDPTYSSTEVENIVWHGFGESCNVKIVQRTTMSSPHSGQAFAIFNKREAAQKVITKLDSECLMLPNGRPLVGTPYKMSLPGNQSQYHGHLSIEKLKHQMQKEMRDAVSTSHSVQANTIEYEMALEWRLLQDRSDLCWELLYKKQGEEVKNLTARLKSK